MASFDREDTNDADYALFDAVGAAGVDARTVPGRFSKAVSLVGKLFHYGSYRYAMGHIIYNGRANVNMKRGTLEFWIRSAEGQNIWADGALHQLAHATMSRSPEYAGRPRFELLLTKTKDGLLRFEARGTVKNTEPVPVPGIEEPPPGQGAVALPARYSSPAEWHHVLVAWDVQEGGRLWLSVDGKGVTDAFTTEVEPIRPRPATQLIIGGKAGGEVIDDLRVTNAPIARRIKGAQRAAAGACDEKRLIREEDAVRRWLDLMMRLQVDGGWYVDYDARSGRPAPRVPWNTIKNSDYFGPGQVGSVFLRAYDLFDDERYLDVARRTAEMILKLQHEDGHFDAYFYATPMGVMPHVLSYAAIEELKQHSPLWFLTHIHAVTGDARYLAAARKVADFLLEAQNDDGSWPWGYDLKTKEPVGAHAAFNDQAIKWSAEDMLFMHQLTGEKRYLASLLRCVEWVLSVQLPAPTYGWAEQYGEKRKPCWARGFEPPAFGTSATMDAIQVLLLAYDVTGERRYLTPIQKVWDWQKSVKVHGHYHDIKTGTRICALNGKIYFHGTKEWNENFGNFFRWRAYERPRIAPWLEKNDGLRSNGPCFRSTLTRTPRPRSKFAELTPTREQLARFAATHQGYKSGTAGAGWVDQVLQVNEEVGTGSWVKGVRDRNGVDYFSTHSYKWANIFLNRILAARIALGYLPISRFPRHDPERDDTVYRFFWIQPDRDWYDLGAGR